MQIKCGEKPNKNNLAIVTTYFDHMKTHNTVQSFENFVSCCQSSLPRPENKFSFLLILTDTYTHTYTQKNPQVPFAIFAFL